MVDDGDGGDGGDGGGGGGIGDCNGIVNGKVDAVFVASDDNDDSDGGDNDDVESDDTVKFPKCWRLDDVVYNTFDCQLIALMDERSQCFLCKVYQMNDNVVGHIMHLNAKNELDLA
uniref:Uncharacterized protein n=1 Tax=Glossina pallidipes TaxID=7398 RepID=A0A1B0A155_GLOPL